MYNNRGICNNEGGIKMEENNLTMADLMAEVDKSMTRIHRGDLVKAKVVMVQEDGVIVNIGYHADGLIPWNEMSYDEVDKDNIHVDDTFDVQIIKVDDGEGNVLVSKKRAETETALEDIQKLFDAKQQFTVRVKEVVKGGVIASVKGFRAFIPGSQLTNAYVEDLNAYVGKDLEVEIIEFIPEKRKLVLSGKKIAAQKAEAEKTAKLATLEEGQKVSGVVTKLMPYGAFVNIGGVEGLVHNTDLSWKRIKHPSDVVKEGDKIEVTIVSVDKETGKIALSHKDVTVDPWILEAAHFTEGENVMAKVTRFMTFGAFAALSENVEGLIHISQISEKRVHKVEDELTLGQEVKVKILSIDKENKKIALSMKAVEEELDDEMKQYVSSDEEKVTLGDVIQTEA